MYTFKKEERLCSQKLIDELFHNGSSFLLYPYRVNYLLVKSMEVSVKVLFQVPKRKYKRAVDRNLIKRRIREIYRLQKSQCLYPFIPDGSTLLLSIVYVGKEIHDFSLMEEKTKKLWMNLVKQLQQQMGGNAE
jgi:ribonuclease P protein component